MPISVSQKPTIPGNFREGAIKQLSIVKRAVKAIEQNAKAIQLAIKYAKQFNGLNTQFSRFAEDTNRAMYAFRDAQKTFLPDSLVIQQMDLLKAYSYHEKLFPFPHHEIFWPSFSQPPQLPAFSTFSSSGVISEERWLPQFYPQRVRPTKSNLNKTIPKTFSTREKFRDKFWKYFFIKESRGNFEKFWRDLQEDNQKMKCSECSKSLIYITFGFKVLTKFWVFLLGCGIFTLYKIF